MKAHRAGDGERSLAVFIDFENMGLGFNNRRDRFEISKVLERLVEKGKIVCKKAYADWSRFGMYTGALHESAIELIEIPRRGMTGKNSADIRLVVDAIDLAYSKDHIDTFVIVSGDSDFSPLVSKLKELGKHVIGLGLSDATSDLLRDNCDEFIYYEDLDRAPIIPIAVNEQIPEKKRKVFALLLDSLLALRRENKEVIYSSMLKDTIKRKKPSFNEDYYGYRTFSELLEDAQREGLLELDKHRTSGMYVVTRFGLEMKVGALPTVSRVIPLPKGGEGRRPIELVPRNGNGGPASEPKKALELPPRGAAEQRRAELPPRAEPPQRPESEPRKVEPPKPAAVAPSPAAAVPRPTPARPVPPAPAPARPAPQPKPPAPKREDADDDRPLGRALVDDFDDLDDEPLDEVPTYAPRKAEVKPATAPARPAPAKPVPAPKPIAAKEPAPAKPAPKPVATPEPVPAKPVLAKPAPAKAPARAATEGTEHDAPAVKPGAKPKPATKAAGPKPAAKPPAKEPPARPRQPDPKPPSDDDEFGAGL
ncbi:NYN domain-containing protein [Gemmata sp. JC717]|uniref:NYN domain-containing protein n=1 Tax=Gemmata algarum TaxID=2975278 RepID=UPI0021BA7F59|nr:NYN domain-containing protein [Gemmata algarum]MDY3553379.1 NYN domain-containing protein [Gemmata algarum]